VPVESHRAVRTAASAMNEMPEYILYHKGPQNMTICNPREGKGGRAKSQGGARDGSPRNLFPTEPSAPLPPL